nr:reverse transcriptase domain-containing protein [Tanacetum cinerariifolium]
MDEAHATRYSIYPGANKMYHDLRDMYWWLGMKKDIATYAADRVVASTLGSAITIPETANKFAIKALFDRLLREIQAFSQYENESLTDAWLRMKEMLQNCHGYNLSKGNIIKIFYHGLSEITQEVLNAVAGGSSNSDTNKIMAQMDAMTLKMDAHYKELQSNAKKAKPDLDEDDIPISREEEAKFTQTFLNPNDQQNDSENPINFDSDEEDEEPTPQPKTQNPKPVKETSFPKPYKLKIPDPQRLRKEKMEAQYGNFLDMIRELISNKHKIKQISVAFLSDESLAMIQNKVPPKLGDPESFLILCNFNKTFSCNALADLGASINLMSYSLYAKLSLETLKPTKISVRLANRSFQYPVGIAKNMLVEVGKFTFPANFIILEMEEDIKQLNLGVETERMIFNIDSAMIHSYSNDDTCFSIDVIDEILEEDFDALLDEGSKILHSIEGTFLEEEIFAEFEEFMAMTVDKNSNSESDTEEPPFKKITINTDYKIKTSLEEPPTNLKLKPLPVNLGYVFLEEPSFLLVIISSHLFIKKKDKLVSVLKKHKQAFAWKTTNIPGIFPSFCNHKIQLLDDKKPVVQKQISPWVSPIHYVPKKGGITVVTNENDELIPTRTITGWRVCIDCRKLNEAAAKDHFPLPFMDQMLERLAGNKYFCFLDGFSSAGLEVDIAKVDVISKLLPPTNIKVGAVLGQKDDRNFHPIYFASRTFNLAQQKYIIPEKELMAVVFAFEKFRSYLVLSKTIVHTDHSALRHLFKKQDAKPRLIRWILLLQEFDIEIKDRKGTDNVASDHLSIIKNDETSADSEVDDNIPEETLIEINTKDEPWFANFANYLVGDIIPKRMTYPQKNKFFSNLKHYFLEESFLFKVCSNGMIRRCISGPETRTILDQCHHGPTGRHYGPNITTKKSLIQDFTGQQSSKKLIL